MNRVVFSKPSFNYREFVKKDIKSVAREFEALLIKQILKEAYRPIIRNKGFYQRMYYDMFLDGLSQKLSEAGGIGIARFVVESYNSHRDKDSPEELRRMVEDKVRSFGLPSWVARLPEVESGFNPKALSDKGAGGLWQLMPETAKSLGLRVDEEVDERFDPVKSTDASLRYIKSLYDKFKSWVLVLIAYNWGEGNLMRVGADRVLKDLTLIPKETRDYIKKVLGMVR